MKRGDIVIAWDNKHPDNKVLTVYIRMTGGKYGCVRKGTSLSQYLGGGEYEIWLFDNAVLYENKCTQKVKNPVEIMIHLLDQGYEVDQHGEWFSESVDKVCFTPEMWQYCGKEKPDIWVWEPEWLE